MKYIKEGALIGVSSLFLLPLFAVPTFAQDGEVSNRLSRMEREIDTLSRTVYRGETPPPPSRLSSGTNSDASYRANLEVRLNSIEEQIRGLTGRLEENQYKIEQLQKNFNRFSTDMEMRMNEAQAKPQPQSQPVKNDNTRPVLTVTDEKPSTDVNTTTVDVPDNDVVVNSSTVKSLATDSAQMYQNAYTHLKDNNIRSAQDGFIKFLEVYPDDKLATNAQYWLAETYYVSDDYENAARVFATAYKSDIKGSKAPDNLLKLALSLKGLGREEDACVALTQLDKEFGATQSSVVQRGRTERQNIACE